LFEILRLGNYFDQNSFAVNRAAYHFGGAGCTSLGIGFIAPNCYLRLGFANHTSRIAHPEDIDCEQHKACLPSFRPAVRLCDTAACPDRLPGVARKSDRCSCDCGLCGGVLLNSAIPRKAQSL